MIQELKISKNKFLLHLLRHPKSGEKFVLVGRLSMLGGGMISSCTLKDS